MFDFAWSELGVIAVAALIFIGPKDMPIAIKSVTGMIKKARRMASEFQTHVDDLVREADLTEVRDQLNELRSYASPAAIEKLIDEDGSIRRSFDDPFKSTDSTAPAEAAYGATDVAVAERIEADSEVAADAEPTTHVEADAEPARPEMPAFIPPSAAPRTAAAHPDVPPAFIPPTFAQRPPLGPAA